MAYEDDEDECGGSGANLRGYLERITVSKIDESALGEIIYTANETGLLESEISFEDAITVWKMVELARASADGLVKGMISEIRM